MQLVRLGHCSATPKCGSTPAAHWAAAAPPAMHNHHHPTNSHRRSGLVSSTAPLHPAVSAVRLLESLTSSAATAAGNKQAPTTNGIKTPIRNEASVHTDSAATHASTSTNGRASIHTQLLAHLQQCLQTGSEPNAVLCNQALRALSSNSSRWPNVWHAFQVANSAGAQLSEDTCLQLCFKAIECKWVAHAAVLWQAATKAHGGPLDQRSYVTVISKLLKYSTNRGVPNQQLAYKLWRELFEAYRTNLDGASIRAGVHACCKMGRFEEAEKLLQWSRKIGVRAGHGAYNRLISGYAARGRMNAVVRTFKAMTQQGYMPDRVTWNTMIWGFAHQGDVRKAEVAMKQAKLQGCLPDALSWSSLLHGYARTGDMGKAEEALDRMRQQQQEQQEKFKEEQQRYQEALVSAANGGANNQSSNSSSSSRSSSSKNPSQGASRSEALPSPPQPPEQLLTVHAFGALVDGYMKGANAAAAEDAVQRMRQEGIPPSRIVYNTLLRGYIKLGVSGQARASEIVREMQEAGLVSDVDTLTTLLQVAEEGVGGLPVMPTDTNTTTTNTNTTPTNATAPASLFNASTTSTSDDAGSVSLGNSSTPTTPPTPSPFMPGMMGSPFTTPGTTAPPTRTPRMLELLLRSSSSSSSSGSGSLWGSVRDRTASEQASWDGVLHPISSMGSGPFLAGSSSEDIAGVDPQRRNSSSSGNGSDAGLSGSGNSSSGRSVSSSGASSSKSGSNSGRDNAPPGGWELLVLEEAARAQQQQLLLPQPYPPLLPTRPQLSRSHAPATTPHPQPPLLARPQAQPSSTPSPTSSVPSSTPPSPTAPTPSTPTHTTPTSVSAAPSSAPSTSPAAAATSSVQPGTVEPGGLGAFNASKEGSPPVNEDSRAASHARRDSRGSPGLHQHSHQQRQGAPLTGGAPHPVNTPTATGQPPATAAPALAGTAAAANAAGGAAVGTAAQQQQQQLMQRQLWQRQQDAAYGSFSRLAALIAGSSLAGRERILALLLQLQRDGLAPDGALLTTLMMTAARQGEYDLALQVFEAHASNPQVTTDTCAWNALATVHAVQGAMQYAELAAVKATEAAAAQGHGPPEQSYLALVRGYGRAGDLRRVLAVVRRFMALGGRPKQRMLDPVVKLCLQRGESMAAYKVVRAAELTGAEIDRTRYAEWIQSWQKQRAQSAARAQQQGQQQRQLLKLRMRQQAQEQQARAREARMRAQRQGQQQQVQREGGEGEGEDGRRGLERIKWFLGLPNRYYSSE